LPGCRRHARLRFCSQSGDVKDGVIAYKIATHAADLAKGHPAVTTARDLRRQSLGNDTPVGFFSRPGTFSRKPCY
jgi:hypothetical protein